MNKQDLVYQLGLLWNANEIAFISELEHEIFGLEIYRFRFGGLAIISAILHPGWNPAMHNPVSFDLLFCSFL